MTANFQRQIDTLETRTDSLENVLGQFIASMNDMMIRREADTKAFKEEVRADTKSLKKEMESFKASVNETLARSEAGTEAFKTSMNDMMIRREADTKAFKEEVRADTKSLKKEMESFKTSVNESLTRSEAGTDAFKTSVNETLTRSEAGTEAFKTSVNETLTRSEAGTEAFKTSVNETLTRSEAGTDAFKTSVNETLTRSEAGTEAFKTSVNEILTRMEADSQKHRKEMNKKWGDLSNKMGTLVEDMVAPNIPGIAREFFGDDEPDFFAVRVMKRNTKNPGRRREFDVIAMTERNFYVNETKSNPKPEYVGKFIEALGEIGDYFPESRGKRIIPIFASLHIPEDTRTYLTRRGIYAMGMREDTMTLLNFGELSDKGGQSRT